MGHPDQQDSGDDMRIVIQKDGPDVVRGGAPLVRKEQVVSEHGEPLTWRRGETIDAPETYVLCRCGKTATPPFCDQTHACVEFDGAETADPRPTVERQIVLRDGAGIQVSRDYSICAESGFCANRFTTVEKLAPYTGDTQVRAQVIGMIERCPSGSYTYRVDAGEGDIEPDLPRQIAVTVEITSQGPIPGPLWVTGRIPIRRSDGKPMETRNRVTLCRCGHSGNKPLCDGTHRALQSAGRKPE